jgi:hypothetical protein
MAAEHFQNWVEGKGEELRRICNVPTFGRLDPYALASAMGVSILDPHEILGLKESTLPDLLGSESHAWSAGTLHLPDGRILVVMNPTHAQQRQRSTLMEELAHVRLKHKPSQLASFDGLSFSRSYNKTQEREAYWVGAAALLPRRAIKGAKTLGWTVQKVAKEHGVSEELVEFRENITGIRLPREQKQPELF